MLDTIKHYQECIDLCHSAAMLSLKLCFYTASLALNSRLRLGEACRAKAKLFISLRLNMAPHEKVYWVHMAHTGTGQLYCNNL